MRYIRIFKIENNAKFFVIKVKTSKEFDYENVSCEFDKHMKYLYGLPSTRFSIIHGYTEMNKPCMIKIMPHNCEFFLDLE